MDHHKSPVSFTPLKMTNLPRILDPSLNHSNGCGTSLGPRGCECMVCFGTPSLTMDRWVIDKEEHETLFLDQNRPHPCKGLLANVKKKCRSIPLHGFKTRYSSNDFIDQSEGSLEEIFPPYLKVNDIGEPLTPTDLVPTLPLVPHWNFYLQNTSLISSSFTLPRTQRVLVWSVRDEWRPERGLSIYI